MWLTNWTTTCMTSSRTGWNHLTTRFSRWRAKWMAIIWGVMAFAAILSDHRSGTISRATNYVGKRNVIRNKICWQCVEICHLCYINAQKVRQQKFVAQRINYGANKPHISHKQGFVLTSTRLIELEGEVGLLYYTNNLTVNIVSHNFDWFDMHSLDEY